jgi:hypothetical protein
MKKEYDFRKATRGAIEKPIAGKTRITIRLDNEVLEWFRAKVDDKGGGNYQTMINDALLEYIKKERGTIAEALRRVLREELPRFARDLSRKTG